MAYSNTMTFNQIYSEVINLRFSQAQLTSVQHWVNHRYAELWDMDEWVFKYQQATNLTVTAGSQILGNLPSPMGVVVALYRDDGYPVLYRPPRDFWDLYATLTDQENTGDAQHYTIIDGVVFLGPIPSTSVSTYRMVYEQDFVPLVNDSDVPAIPSNYHYLLVTGALSEGCRLMNDFTWEFQEQDWQRGLQSMRERWLVDQRGEVGEWGRDQIEALPTAWGT